MASSTGLINVSSLGPGDPLNSTRYSVMRGAHMVQLKLARRFYDEDMNSDD